MVNYCVSVPLMENIEENIELVELNGMWTPLIPQQI